MKTLVVGGARIGFEVDESSFAEVVAAFEFAGGVAVDAPPVMRYRMETRRRRRVFVRDDPLADAGRPERVCATVRELVSSVHESVALHATEAVFVHAGVVGWKGRAVLLPGRSRAGKSTLVAALVRAGATYLSDEYALVLPDGRVEPYLRPIQLRSPHGPRLVAPGDLGEVESEPLPLGAVVVTQHRPEAELELRRVAPAEAALVVFDNTIIAETRPRLAISTAAAVARSCPTLRSDRPDAELVTHALLDAIEACWEPTGAA